MASSRVLPASYTERTYDSGDGTKDYTVLDTWEAATDNDMNGTGEVLSCYARAHNDLLTNAAGASNLSSTEFRLIRPYPGEGHSGIPKVDGSCVAFANNTNNQDMLTISEEYFQIHDIVAKNTDTDAELSDIYAGSDEIKIIGCLLFDSTAASSENYGIYTNHTDGENIYIINCLFHNHQTTGIVLDDNRGDLIVYNVTENGSGVEAMYIGANVVVTSKNCVYDSGVTNNGTHNETTCTNNTPTYVDSGNDDFHLAVGDAVCRGNGTDLSADGTYAFDDDIDGDTRSAWDIGFDEYVAAGISIPVAMHHYTKNIASGR